MANFPLFVAAGEALTDMIVQDGDQPNPQRWPLTAQLSAAAALGGTVRS